MTLIEAANDLLEALQMLTINADPEHPAIKRADKAIYNWRKAAQCSRTPDDYEAEIRRLKGIIEHAASRMSYLGDDLKNNLN